MISEKRGQGRRSVVGDKKDENKVKESDGFDGRDLVLSLAKIVVDDDVTKF